LDLEQFKSNFAGGTRSNRFLVTGSIGNFGTAATKHSFHIRSTFIPPVTNITLSVNAYGRKVNIPGDREYSPWQITVYDDIIDSEEVADNPNHLWDLFTDWNNDINNHVLNHPTSGGAAGSFPYLDYKKEWRVTQLDLNGNVTPLKTFILKGCWPKTVSDIDFNMTRRNFMNTFSVIMLYDEIEILDSNGDELD
jgi:hypothetical protein